MKKQYVKPVVLEDEDVMEGVYMLTMKSGCYTASAEIKQRPEIGRQNYVIQVNGKHQATHSNDRQVLHISFNLPVEYVSSGGTLKSGNGSTSLDIDYSYHQNGNDNIGLGDLVVKAEPGLAISTVSITDGFS